MSGALAIRRAASPDAAALSAIGRETFVLTFGHLYEALSAIGRETFVLTFGHLYAPEDLAAFLDDSHSVASYAALLDDPRYGLWLLEEEGVGGRKRVVGFAVAGPCGLPHPDVAPADGELKRLYLLPEIQNGGWGGKLFDTAIDWLQRQGRHRIWISVWSENFGAQRFYARHGFGKVAEYEFPVGRHRDIEFMYRRDPAGGAGTR